jgi:hypothetical protein
VIFARSPGACGSGTAAPGKISRSSAPPVDGTAQVERFKHIDVRTGQEIDYEKPGQKFVYADEKQSGIQLAR